MHVSRKIASFTAILALLAASWTSATHWHFQYRQAQNTQANSKSILAASGPSCCCHAQSEHPCSNELPNGHSPDGSDDSNCSICSFLAGHAMEIQSDIQLSLAEVVEPFDYPTILLHLGGDHSTVSCRGPPSFLA